MRITKFYKYRKDGKIYVGGSMPEDSEKLEVLDILNAEEGFVLVSKRDRENVGSSVWLYDGDSQDNYIEVKEPEEGVDNAS